MSIGRICNREVDLAEPDETVQSAAERMLQRGVGTLIVLNGAKQPVGIVTDRDLALRVLALHKNPTETTVRSVMTGFAQSVFEDTPIEDAIGIMKTHVFRRLPVVDRADNKLVGVVSLDDILLLLAEEITMIGQLLERETPAMLASAKGTTG